MTGWLFGLAKSLGRKRLESEMDEELRFHLEMEIRQNLRRGLPADEARRRARLQFGGLEAVKDGCRDAARADLLERALQELSRAARGLRRRAGFSLACILTLALGIGANTAIFSLVNGLLLRPLPYRDADRLVRLRQQAPRPGVRDAGFSFPEIEHYRAATDSLEAIAEYHSMWFVLLGGAEPQRVLTGVVSASYFDLLGIEPYLGRSFREADERPDAEAVLMLSWDYWQRSTGGDPDVLGRVFEMNDRPHRVVGILPPLPRYPTENHIYVPTQACPFRSNPATLTNPRARMLAAIGRIRTGASLAEAEEDLAKAASLRCEQHPDLYSSDYHLTAETFTEEITSGARPTLLLLLLSVGLVLLAACANVANLVLASLLRRVPELSMRQALGASRAQLAGMLLSETMLLGLAGGVVGLAVAAVGLDLLTSFFAGFTPRTEEVTIDGVVLLFTGLVSLATGIFFGLLPILSRRLAGVVLSSGRGQPGTGVRRLRAALIVAQLAVSFALLIGAGLLVRSLVALERVDPGFESSNVLTLTVSLNWSRYEDDDSETAFYSALLDEASEISGVESAAIALAFPLSDRSQFLPRDLVIERSDGSARVGVELRSTSAGYFETLGLPLVEGRVFAARPGLAEVVINQSLASRQWGAESPLGDRISFDGGRQWHTIVGVVGSVRQHRLEQPPADEIYIPFLNDSTREASLLVRSRVAPELLEPELRKAVYTIDPQQPVADVQTLEQVRTQRLLPPRVRAGLLSLFGLLALAITAAGIAGLVAFSVARRNREFGVRIALGATPASILWLAARPILTLVAAGLLVGGLVSLSWTGPLEGVLFRVEPVDPLTWALVALLLIAVSVASCLAPAWRAAAGEPLQALRSE